METCRERKWCVVQIYFLGGTVLYPKGYISVSNIISAGNIMADFLCTSSLKLIMTQQKFGHLVAGA